MMKDVAMEYGQKEIRKEVYMLNQIVLVGRLVQEPLVIETEVGKKAKISIH